MDIDPDANNGLITKSWGSAGWTFGHSITKGYPLHPTKEQKADFRAHFESLAKVLPCCYCRDSYSYLISNGETKLRDEDLESRETLFHWFYRIHQAVNKKLEIDYAVTLQDASKRFESFRARCGTHDPSVKGCVTPLNYKAFTFRNLYELDPPFITLESASRFRTLAEFHNIPRGMMEYFRMAERIGGDVEQLKSRESWGIRRRICRKIIKRMRINGVSSVDEKGLPTFPELMLIMMLSSNLNRSELDECAAQLDVTVQ